MLGTVPPQHRDCISQDRLGDGAVTNKAQHLSDLTQEWGGGAVLVCVRSALGWTQRDG